MRFDRMKEFPEITVYGPKDVEQRGGLVAFTLGDVHAHDIATFADQDGVAIRAGHHCAMPLHKKLGLAATARASFYLYNTRDEVDVFIEMLHKAKKFFGACPTAARWDIDPPLRAHYSRRNDAAAIGRATYPGSADSHRSDDPDLGVLACCC